MKPVRPAHREKVLCFFKCQAFLLEWLVEMYDITQSQGGEQVSDWGVWR